MGRFRAASSAILNPSVPACRATWEAPAWYLTPPGPASELMQVSRFKFTSDSQLLRQPSWWSMTPRASVRIGCLPCPSESVPNFRAVAKVQSLGAVPFAIALLFQRCYFFFLQVDCCLCLCKGQGSERSVALWALPICPLVALQNPAPTAVNSGSCIPYAYSAHWQYAEYALYRQ